MVNADHQRRALPHACVYVHLLGPEHPSHPLPRLQAIAPSPRCEQQGVPIFNTWQGTLRSITQTTRGQPDHRPLLDAPKRGGGGGGG